MTSMHKKKGSISLLPEQVRPEVLEAFFNVFEEDLGILEDLRDR
ncbi:MULTISPECIES: hypothetical protein [Paenibacillus]|uniref:Transposase n=1 Tax=Paenibacillus rhizoplanae TaxID=1917181 RepID=A0ABW5F2C7_9BACL